MCKILSTDALLTLYNSENPQEHSLKWTKPVIKKHLPHYPLNQRTSPELGNLFGCSEAAGRMERMGSQPEHEVYEDVKLMC